MLDFRQIVYQYIPIARDRHCDGLVTLAGYDMKWDCLLYQQSRRYLLSFSPHVDYSSR